MQNKNLFDDLSRIFAGLGGSLIGIKDDLSKFIHNKIEEYLKSANLVTRDEFEVLKMMVTKLMEENKELKEKLDQ